MNINPVTNQQNFEGKVIVKNPISSQQNYLFQRHRHALETQIKDMPFDLYVEQSKSKKTISLTAGIKDANSYIVRKNKQDFEAAAGYAIADGMQKSEACKKLVKANEILNYTKLHMLQIFSGNIKEARETHKQIAKLAVEDFKTYKEATNFKITNLPPEAGKPLLINSLKYRLYYAISPKTPEEKQMEKMNKEYLKEMKAQKKEIEPQEIKFPQW